MRAFLVKRRPLFNFLLPLVLAVLAEPSVTFFLAGLCLAALGEAIRMWSAGVISKAQEVTAAGPYAHVRHPLYVGSLLIGLGYCFMSGLIPWSIPLMLVLMGAVYYATIEAEEAHLGLKFGAAYEEYAAAVPKYVPRLTARKKSETGFSLERLKENREHRYVLVTVGFIVVFALRLVFHV